MANLALLVPVFLLAFFIREGSPVRCLSCSSELNQYCVDPLRYNSELLQQSTCDADDGATYPYFTSYKSVCKTQKKYRSLLRCLSCASDLKYCAEPDGLLHVFPVFSLRCKKLNGQLVISRGCSWKRSDDYSNNCPSTSNGPNEVTIYCKTCDYDGCNGAAAVGKTIALLLAPMALFLLK